MVSNNINNGLSFMCWWICEWEIVRPFDMANRKQQTIWRSPSLFLYSLNIPVFTFTTMFQNNNKICPTWFFFQMFVSNPYAKNIFHTLACDRFIYVVFVEKKILFFVLPISFLVYFDIIHISTMKLQYLWNVVFVHLCDQQISVRHIRYQNICPSFKLVRRSFD